MMPTSESGWPAPAKLNLFLHVTARRADGYHTLQTLFQFVDLCDRLHFELRDDGVIRRIDGPAAVAPEDDLCVRAARRLALHAGHARGVDIRLDKRIPVGGGLGGGSSDAATTLVALNRLWQLNLPRDTLAQLGRELGADVPVFVLGRAAWAEGVGERLQPVDVPEPWFVIVAPNVHVATGEIFGAAELRRDHPPVSLSDFDAGRTANDCEPVTCGRYPPVAAALAWLRTQVPAAAMSGTGACVFAACESREHAERIAAQAPPDCGIFVAKGLNRSPLADIIAPL